MPGRKTKAARPAIVLGLESDPAPANLPPRRSKTKAIEDQVWQRDAPKRKRKPEDAIDNVVVAHHPEQAKKRREDVEKVSKPNQTKNGTSTKQLPTGKRRCPVLQRSGLLADEDEDAGVVEKHTPLPPKVVVTADKRQSRQVKKNPAFVSNSKKGPAPKDTQLGPADGGDGITDNPKV